MPYIEPNGRVLSRKPWNLQRLVGIFWGIVAFFVMFIRNLFGHNVNRHGEDYQRDYRGGGGPPKPPSHRRIQGFRNVPSPSCPGGGCGR